MPPPPISWPPWTSTTSSSTSTTVAWAERPQTLDERREWFEVQQRRGFVSLVAVDGDEVVGMTSYGDFRDSIHWPGYRFTAELSIHVRGDQRRNGVGRLLMEELIARAGAKRAPCARCRDRRGQRRLDPVSRTIRVRRGRTDARDRAQVRPLARPRADAAHSALGRRAAELVVRRERPRARIRLPSSPNFPWDHADSVSDGAEERLRCVCGSWIRCARQTPGGPTQLHRGTSVQVHSLARVGATVSMVIVVLTVTALPAASESTAPAGAATNPIVGPSPNGDVGVARDVSFPQCGGSLPRRASADFGVLGTNNGISFTRNPCLVRQLAWAKSLPLAPAFYANTGNPGPQRARHWPSRADVAASVRGVGSELDRMFLRLRLECRVAARTPWRPMPRSGCITSTEPMRDIVPRTSSGGSTSRR